MVWHDVMAALVGLTGYVVSVLQNQLEDRELSDSGVLPLPLDDKLVVVVLDARLLIDVEAESIRLLEGLLQKTKWLRPLLSSRLYKILSDHVVDVEQVMSVLTGILHQLIWQGSLPPIGKLVLLVGLDVAIPLQEVS